MTNTNRWYPIYKHKTPNRPRPTHVESQRPRPRCVSLRSSLALRDSEDDISLTPELADLLTGRDAIARYAIASMMCDAADELVENYDTLYYRNFCQHYIPTNPREDIIKRLLDTI